MSYSSWWILSPRACLISGFNLGFDSKQQDEHKKYHRHQGWSLAYRRADISHMICFAMWQLLSEASLPLIKQRLQERFLWKQDQLLSVFRAQRFFDGAADSLLFTTEETLSQEWVILDRSLHIAQSSLPEWVQNMLDATLSSETDPVFWLIPISETCFVWDGYRAWN